MPHEKFMQRALELASLGKGWASPNPMVGCVIVYKGKIIGEGYHMKYGGPHAEVNAVNSVIDHSLLPDSEVYVTLEPCSHFGKTPPCADLLIEKQIKKVFICNGDPNPLVAGRGIEKLQAFGTEVVTGILEKEGLYLNRRFFSFHKKKRPHILLKWAETADGFVARKDFSSKWISNDISRILVHKWRSEEMAIMVGTNTAFYDNPRLSVRDWTGRQPLRVVIDRQLRLKKDLNVFDQTQPTVCYNLHLDQNEENLSYVKLQPDNFFQQVMADLHKRNVHSVMVEGGTMLIHELVVNELWDEARVFKSPVTFGEGILAPVLTKNELLNIENIQDDKLFIWKRIE